jgi:hypothetical protein
VSSWSPFLFTAGSAARQSRNQKAKSVHFSIPKHGAKFLLKKQEFTVLQCRVTPLFWGYSAVPSVVHPHLEDTRLHRLAQTSAF